MKKIILMLGMLAILLCLQAEVLDRIVAKVGREVILQSDLAKRIQQLEAAGMISKEITGYEEDIFKNDTDNNNQTSP